VAVILSERVQFMQLPDQRAGNIHHTDRSTMTLIFTQTIVGNGTLTYLHLELYNPKKDVKQ